MEHGTVLRGGGGGRALKPTPHLCAVWGIVCGDWIGVFATAFRDDIADPPISTVLQIQSCRLPPRKRDEIRTTAAITPTVIANVNWPSPLATPTAAVTQMDDAVVTPSTDPRD